MRRNAPLRYPDVEDLIRQGTEKWKEKQTFLGFSFPDQKKEIAKLSYEDKMEWYAHQFQKDPGKYPVELTTAEFLRFWRWRVLMPIKLKRFYYKLKNGEIFKKYQHISEMKKKGPQRI